MDRLIEFAYTASISVGEKCVIHVMNGAVMYQIDSVVKACCDFLVQQLDPSNAIGIANFAEQISCTELHQKAREYIYMNFSQVKTNQYFFKYFIANNEETYRKCGERETEQQRYPAGECCTYVLRVLTIMLPGHLYKLCIERPGVTTIR